MEDFDLIEPLCVKREEDELRDLTSQPFTRNFIPPKDDTDTLTVLPWDQQDSLMGPPPVLSHDVTSQFPAIELDVDFSMMPALTPLRPLPAENLLRPFPTPVTPEKEAITKEDIESEELAIPKESLENEELDEESDAEANTMLAMDDEVSPPPTPREEKPTQKQAPATKKQPQKANSRASSQTKTEKERPKRRKSEQSKTPTAEEKRNMSAEELAEWKRQQRLKRNRASAQLSRERRKKYVTQLEAKIEELTKHNTSLKQKVQSLSSENNRLRQKLGLDLSQEPLSPISTSTASTCSSPKLEDDDTASSWEPSPKRIRANAMTMFAFVLSFGFFFSWMGIGGSPWPSSVSQPARATRPLRVLTEVENHPDLSVDLLSDYNNMVVSAEEDQKSYQAKKLVVSDRDYALVSLQKPDFEEAQSQTDVTIASDLLQKSVDLYRGEDEAQDYDFQKIAEAYAAAAAVRLRKLMQDANLTLSEKDWYLLCPHATALHYDPDTRTTRDNTSLHSLALSQAAASRAGKRLRKAMSQEREETKSPKGKSIMVWVPTSSLESSLWKTQDLEEQSPSGLSQITCQVSDVRPVVVEKSLPS
eukprot:g70556.t1